MRGEQHLVSCDNRCALLDRFAHPLVCGRYTTDNFNDNIGTSGEYVIEAVGPDHRRRDPIGALARHTTIEDVRQLESIGQFRTLDENPRNRRTDSAKSKQRDFERRLLARGCGITLQFTGYRPQVP